MGSIKLSVHPLFFALGFYYALTGRIFIFVIVTVCAIVHELGHSFVASGLGYKLDKITLMPFGAVVSGEIDGLKLKDEIKVALAGPLINLAIAFFFIAWWWIYPSTYAYTDVVVHTNLSLAIVNLLPIFPLDGGRVLSAFLGLRLDKKKALLIVSVTGIIFSAILLSLFVASLFYQANLSLLIFGLFVLFGVIGKSKENKYVKVLCVTNSNDLFRGVEIKRQAIDKNSSVKRLLALVDSRCINEIVLFDKGKEVLTINQEKINEILLNGQLYSPISQYL